LYPALAQGSSFRVLNGGLNSEVQQTGLRFSLVGCKRCPETQHFSGPIVEVVSDFVEVFLGVDAQVNPFGQILADEAIGVFVGRPYGLWGSQK
jgi:hypothetical protein